MADEKPRYWIPSRRIIPWISRTHVALYKLTGGLVGAKLRGKPGLLLRTTGRKTGQIHTVCLPYLPDGDDKIVVASFAGAPQHPAWYLNLAANPIVTVRDRGRVYTATATTVGGADRPAMWQRVVDDAPWYADYQVLTDREIPLVVLSPAPG